MQVPYLRILPDGSSQIIRAEAISHLRSGNLPSDEENYKTIIAELDRQIREADSRVSQGALNNVHGDWYEWMLAIEAWNICASNEEADLPLLLPNISSYDVARLYKDDLYDLIEDLRKKVLDASTVQLITSNPDFVIISRELVKRVVGDIQPITAISTDILSSLNDAFRAFSGHCNFEDIIGYISVKTSLRPDRRLQISHEGSLMKALYVHLQTREWILRPPGLKYYAITTKATNADREGLKTVATHSITTVSSIPQPAVDELYVVNSAPVARTVFSEILVRL